MEAVFTGRKLFPKDKNYILKNAQINACQQLLEKLRDMVIEMYFEAYNPLRLPDDTSEAILKNRNAPIDHLFPFYFELAGYYRFKFGKNQLEFLFDGSDHHDKYLQEWEETFMLWIKELGKQKPFIRAVLEATVLAHENLRPELIHQRLKWQIAQVFDVKVYRYRGIRELSVA